MKKISNGIKLIICVCLCLSFVMAAFTGCGKKDSKFQIGEKSELDPNIDSWLQIDDDEEDIEVTWWIDSTGWDFYQLSSLIHERTGVKINFQKALKDDGTELSTKIAGDKLPDIITITDYATRIQLFESYRNKSEDYLYSISKLAKIYAPSLEKRIPDDYYTHLTASNGELYGLANNFFSDDDIAKFSETGNDILSNYSIEVRKDYLEAYLDHMHQQNPDFNEDETVTAQQGFIDMCKWVKANFNLTNSNPTVLFAPFKKTAAQGVISETVSALAEYFAVPKEDSQGNLVYEYGTDEFLEVLAFMNELYRNNLVLSANMGYNTEDIITHIRNGRPFAVIGAAHNYSKGFAGRSTMGYNAETKTFDNSYEYVPIVITNQASDAPILLNLAGKGYRVSMITTNCARPDRVIKVFDYLMSEQGQRECYYGKEGVTYEYVVEPGESEIITLPDQSTKEYMYKYGKIEWTDSAKEMLGSTANTWYSAGLKQISLLQNPMYVMMTSVYQAEMDTYQFYVRYANKAPLIPYTHLRTYFKYGADTTDLNYYLNVIDIQEDIEATWIRYLPSIIMAATKAQVESLWRSALQETKIYGYEEWLEYQNKCFQAYKTKLGITYAWPKNDPNYAPAQIKLRGYTEEYYKEIPDFIKISE